ncbi:unnamed protein product, partial [Rotaria socialis]
TEEKLLLLLPNGSLALLLDTGLFSITGGGKTSPPPKSNRAR